MDDLENVFEGEVLILHCHENGDCQEPRCSPFETLTRWILSCSNQLMFSNQNTDAFRPNSIVAKMKVSKSQGWCHDQDDVCQLA